MIQYRFRIGTVARRAWLENDEEAKEFAEFINADEWHRDTTIIKFMVDDMVCQFEIDTADLNNIEPKFKNIKIWQSDIIKL